MNRDGLRRWGPAAVVATAVLAASVVHPATVEASMALLPLPDGSAGGGGGLPIPADKLGHLALYAALAAAAARGTLGTPDPRSPLVVAAVGAFAYGAGIELLQATLPYRSMEALDAAANGVGAVAGASTVGLVHRSLRRSRGDAG